MISEKISVKCIPTIGVIVPQIKKNKPHEQYLETEKSHKDWFNMGAMGKQLGKPKSNPKEIKKSKGTAKHSLRKEK